MRVIKFRGWDEIAKVMHYDVNFIRSGIEGNDWVIFISDKRPLSSKHHPFEDPFFQEQIKIMQFTGLTDANGVEIYESDIVEDHNGIGIVKYSERYAGFRVSYGDGTAKWFYDYNLRGERESIVVLGNFYQHQGLLEFNDV